MVQSLTGEASRAPLRQARDLSDLATPLPAPLAAQSGGGRWGYEAYGVKTGERSFTGSVITNPVNILLIAQGPAPDFQYHALLHITVNENGEVTSTVIEERVSCD
jgi:hypothetical protein